MKPGATTPTADDDALSDRVRAGDERAFTELVERHHAGLVRVARRIVKDGATAEDLVQAAWLSLLDHHEAFEGRSSVRTWLYRVVTNAALSKVTRERHIPRSALAADDDAPVPDPARFRENGHWAEPIHAWRARTPGEVLESKELGRLLAEALETLPERQRLVVQLRDVEGLETDAICNVLGLTESNVRVLLHRGRTRLREALAATYGTPERARE